MDLNVPKMYVHECESIEHLCSGSWMNIIGGARMGRLVTVYVIIFVVFLNKIAIPECIDNFCERQLLPQEKIEKILPC